MFSSIIATTLLVASALATSHMPPASPHSAAPVAGGETVHVVQVGGNNGSLTFSPENTKANVGDIVQFQFWPKNHSVVQAAFASPCMPLHQVQPNVTEAFFSGFMPTASVKTGETLVFSVRVTNEKPMWYYCSQGKHCQAGMVGAINAPESGERTLAAFKQLAGVAVENLSPGQMPSAGPSGAPAGTPGAAPPAGAPPTGINTIVGAAPTPTGVAPFTGGASVVSGAKGGLMGLAIAAIAMFAL